MPRLDAFLVEQAVDAEARKQGVDPAIAKALFRSENVGQKQVDTTIVSPKNALGLMQVLPETLAGLKQQGFVPSDLDYASPQGQIQAGVAVVKELNSRGITKPLEVAAAYNGGDKALKAFRAGQPLNPETTQYQINFTKAIGGKVGDPTVLGSSSERTTTTTKDIPDTISVPLEKSLNRTHSLTDSVLSGLNILQQSILKTNDQFNTATRIQGDSIAASKIAEGGADVGRLKSREQVLSTFGINLNDDGVGNAAVDNAQIILNTQRARAPIDQQIATLRNVNPLQDPAAWLVNNFKALGLREQQSALVDQEAAATSNLTSLQRLASSQAAIQPAAIQQQVQDKALADAHAAKAAAEVQIAQFGQTSNQQLASSIINQLHVSNADTANWIAMARLYQERTASSIGLSERDSAKTELSDQLVNINMFAGSLGLGPFTKTDLNAMSPDKRKILVDASNFKTWGRNIAESSSNLITILGEPGINRVIKDQPVFGKFLQQVLKGGNDELNAILTHDDAVVRETLSRKGLKTDQEKLEYGIGKWLDKKNADLASNNNLRLSKDNPAKADFSVAIDPSMANNLIAKGIIESEKANKPITDEGLLIGLIARGKEFPKEIGMYAKQYSEFYRAATANKAANVGLAQMGFKMPPKYPMSAGITTFFDKRFDAMSASSVEQWLTEQVISGVRNDAMNDTDPARMMQLGN